MTSRLRHLFNPLYTRNLKSAASRILEPEQWVDAYADGLYAYCIVRVRDRQVAEDLVQDTFLSAWKARATYRGEASEKNWLYTILKNKIADHYRRIQIATPLATGEEDIYFDESGHWRSDMAPAASAAEERLNSHEFYRVLASCSERLKPLQRMVFTLKYQDDMDAALISRGLNITDGNVWVLLHRARLHLRACLEKNGWGQ